MSNRVPRITKYRQDGKPKGPKEKGGPNDNSFANMSTEEFGALLEQDMSEPVILKDTEMEEVQEPAHEWAGWSADDIEVFANTSAIETDVENTIQQQEARTEDTAELDGRKEEAGIGHPRVTPVVARKAIQTKPTTVAKPTKPLVQSSLKAAVEKGTAKGYHGKASKPAAMERPKAAAASAQKTKEPPKTAKTTVTTAIVASPLAAAAAAAAAGTARTPTTEVTTTTTTTALASSTREVSSLAAAAAAAAAAGQTTTTATSLVTSMIHGTAATLAGSHID